MAMKWGSQSEVHANMGAIYAMQGGGTDIDNELKIELRTKAKEAFKEAVNYRPSLGSAWVNLALLILAEGRKRWETHLVNNPK